MHPTIGKKVKVLFYVDTFSTTIYGKTAAGVPKRVPFNGIKKKGEIMTLIE